MGSTLLSSILQESNRYLNSCKLLVLALLVSMCVVHPSCWPPACTKCEKPARTLWVYTFQYAVPLSVPHPTILTALQANKHIFNLLNAHLYRERLLRPNQRCALWVTIIYSNRHCSEHVTLKVIKNTVILVVNSHRCWDWSMVPDLYAA